MKKSDLQNRAVIMCGISGSGKTYYARRLEKQGYIRLSADALIWEKAGKGLDNLSEEEKRHLFAECGCEVRKQLYLLLKSGEKVVVDATHCKRSARDEIRIICREVKVEPVFLFCEAGKEELWQRLSQRKGEGPDDLRVTSDELSDYWLGFERPQEDETDFITVK